MQPYDEAESDRMHRLLDKQVREATGPDGELDLAKLLEAIVRSMQLMSEEATALTRELRESTASQLQSVLDHVKDVILTVDEAGHIVSINATGQRVFGQIDAEVAGRPLTYLLPQLVTNESLQKQLESL